jgi:hypothetical protein
MAKRSARGYSFKIQLSAQSFDDFDPGPLVLVPSLKGRECNFEPFADWMMSRIKHSAAIKRPIYIAL